MTQIAIRELKNNLSEIIRRVESGECFVVTVDRRPVAELNPLPRKRRWIPVREAEQLFAGALADRQMLAEIDELVGQYVDELDWHD